MTEAPPPPPSATDPTEGPAPGDGPAPQAGAGAGPATQTPLPPAAAERPPLRRTTRDRVLGGIAGGVARWLGVEPVPVRIGLVVLAVLAPPLALGYLAAWLLVPADDRPSQPVERTRDAGYWFGIFLAAVVVVALAANLDGGPTGGPLVALALLGIGVALWRRGDAVPVVDAAGPGTAAWPSTPTHAAAVASTDVQAGAPAAAGVHGTGASSGAPTGATPPAAGGGVGGGGTAAAAPVAPWSPPPRQPRERSGLGWLTIGVALLATGVAAALDAAGTVALDVTQLVGVAVVVLGLGLVVGALFGRARWLNLVVFVLFPVVLVGSAARGFGDLTDLDLSLVDQLERGIGDRRLVVEPGDALPDTVELGIGENVVDLGELTLDGDARLSIEQGIGEVRVTLPEDVRWELDVAVGAGAVTLREVGPDGTSVDLVDGQGAGRTHTARGGPDTGPLLELDVELGIGEVDLTSTTTTTTEDDR